MYLTRHNIIYVNVDVIISVSSLLFVNESKDVHHFVNDFEFTEASHLPP